MTELKKEIDKLENMRNILLREGTTIELNWGTHEMQKIRILNLINDELEEIKKRLEKEGGG